MQRAYLFDRYCGPVEDADAGITVGVDVGNVISLFDDEF